MWERKRGEDEVGFDADLLADQIVIGASKSIDTLERRLLAAHVRQALDDLSGDDKNARLSALRWFRDPRDHPYSWRYACAHLNINRLAAAPHLEQIARADRMRQKARRFARRSSSIGDVQHEQLLSFSPSRAARSVER